MIQPFVDKFMASEAAVLADLQTAHPESYQALVEKLVTLLANPSSHEDTPDPKRITVIDHGDYQGTQLFIIGADGYQPHVYWAIFVGYGSCSGCDTLDAIRGYSGNAPTEKEARDYWTLMLHMVQKMKLITDSYDVV